MRLNDTSLLAWKPVIVNLIFDLDFHARNITFTIYKHCPLV
jgi:hypothetical protein